MACNARILLSLHTYAYSLKQSTVIAFTQLKTNNIISVSLGNIFALQSIVTLEKCLNEFYLRTSQGRI